MRSSQPQPDSPIALLLLLTCSQSITFTSHAVLSVLLIELATEFQTTVPVVGQLVAVMGLAWGLSAPLMGPLSDRFGRRLLFFGGQGGLAIFNLATALAGGFPAIVVCRVLAALAAGMAGPSNYAILADAFAPAARGRAFGWMLLGFPLSAMGILPAAALLAAGAGWRWVFVAIGLVNAAVVVIGHSLVPPSPVSTGASYRGQLRAVIERPDAIVLLLANLIFQAGSIATMTFLPAFLMQAFGLGLAEVAPILVMAAVGTLVGTIIGGQTADRTDRALVCSLLAAGTGLAAAALFLLTPLLGIAIALAILQAACRSAYMPMYSAMVTSVSDRARGTVLGLNAATNNLGMALGTGSGGLALAIGGYPAFGILVVALGLASAVMLRLGRSWLREVRQPALAGRD